MRDCADLFCEVFDGLTRAEFRAKGEAWLTGPGVDAAASDVEERACAGTLDPAAERERLAAAPADERGSMAFALLRGLDAALAHANPLSGGVPPRGLEEHALRYAESGRLDSGAAAGALVPRFARPGRRSQLPDDLADAFAAVIRVRAADWDACEHRTLPAHARLSRADRAGGLRLAAAPMIREPDELHWEMHERRGMRFYRIHPADGEAAARRVERVISSWDERDVTIGVAPELCLSPALLERWQQELRSRAAAGESRLRLVLAGTGNVERANPPANTAVLLDALTGETLVHQRKIHPFNFHADDLALWGLEDRFAAPIDEDLTRGERLTVIEAGGVRMAILVCEDLARLHAFAGVLHAHGVSLLLVPVFARPTKDRRWERSRADAYGDATGASVVVSNSLVMAAILGTPAPAGTAIAVSSGSAAVGHASEPDDVVVFELDGEAPRVVHDAESATR